jgi:hypothetical protein
MNQNLCEFNSMNQTIVGDNSQENRVHRSNLHEPNTLLNENDDEKC